jgi:hypothetical protein
VTIQTGGLGRHANITNTRQIAERLTDQWPVAHKGAAYREAVKACMDPSAGEKGAGAERVAFIDAAKEADISCGIFEITNDVWPRLTPDTIICDSSFVGSF